MGNNTSKNNQYSSQQTRHSPSLWSKSKRKLLPVKNGFQLAELKFRIVSKWIEKTTTSYFHLISFFFAVIFLLNIYGNLINKENSKKPRGVALFIATVLWLASYSWVFIKDKWN